RGWDSNPRCSKATQRFSRPSRSTTPAPLQGLAGAHGVDLQPRAGGRQYNRSGGVPLERARAAWGTHVYARRERRLAPGTPASVAAVVDGIPAGFVSSSLPLAHRLMAGQRILVPSVGVRVPVGQPNQSYARARRLIHWWPARSLAPAALAREDDGPSSNGRTPGFGPVGRGSNPCGPATTPLRGRLLIP